MKHLFLIVGVLLGVGIVQAQSKDTKNLVANQNFVFKANTALPTRGNSHILTSDFDLTISKDAVVSYLPYYGRSWEAPADPTKSELDFASHNFGYTTEPWKKDGWTVTIKPKDNREVRQMILKISTDGYATLQVISNDLDAISFNGIITETSQKGGQADRGSR